MIRSFVVFGFLSILLGIGWIFYTRPVSSLRQQITTKHAGHRILLLENFIVFQHEPADHLISRISANRGEFYAPNRIEVHGNFRAWRLTESGEESLAAEEGRAWISQPNHLLFAPQSELERAELEKQVHIVRDGYTLLTEQAEYQAKNQRIFGHLPVKLRGRGHWIMGEKGFTLDLDKEEVHLLGRVQGAAQLENTDHP